MPRAALERRRVEAQRSGGSLTSRSPIVHDATRSSSRDSVDRRARQIEPAHVLDHVALRDIVEMTINDTDGLDGRVREAAEIDAVHALLARPAPARPVTSHRREPAFVSFLVIEIDR